MLNNFYVYGPTSMELVPHEALKKWYMHGQWVHVSSIQEIRAKGHACPIVVLPGKDEFKIFQHYMNFSSDRAAAGL